MKNLKFHLVFAALLVAGSCMAQYDSSKPAMRKNVIRYNLTGALLFGFDSYIVLGYERVLSPKRSISINVGRASLPKVTSIITDSFAIGRDQTRSGVNVSVDYRFYLGKENKYAAPRGIYIGPYYSFNRLESERDWTRKNSTASNQIISKSTLTVNTVGFEVGYQFLLGRFAIDMVMAGPGLGIYNYKAKFEGNVSLSQGDKEQLLDAVKQLLVQKFPGMNAVFSDKQFDADGVLKKSTIGYRYIVHIGYNF